jgi:hypothetical protein
MTSNPTTNYISEAIRVFSVVLEVVKAVGSRYTGRRLNNYRICQLSLIRPSATLSRWKKRERAIIVKALARLFWRERVPEGRVRDHCSDY